MNSHNNLQSVSFRQQYNSKYPFQVNSKPTINFLINKKSNLQQMNEQITSRTSDIIKQHHKASKLLKNHHSSNDYQVRYQLPTDYQHSNNAEKYLVKFSSPKNSQLYKFNYGTQFTDFNDKKTNPIYNTASKINPRPSSSKVNFFYENPYSIVNNNSNEKNGFQTPESKKYNMVYHQPYKSTDFILFPNNNNQPSNERNNPSYKNIKFNYVNITPASSYYSSQKSLKRTKSEEKFVISSDMKQEPRKSQYKKRENKRYDGEVFSDMDQGKTFQDKKSISNKQQILNQKVKQYRTPIRPSKVKKTIIAKSKKPNMFEQYTSKLKDKQTLLIAIVLLTLAVVIFIIQLTS